MIHVFAGLFETLTDSLAGSLTQLASLTGACLIKELNLISEFLINLNGLN